MIVGLSRSDGRNMWHGVAWLIGCLMVLWSLGAWALHTVVQWAARRGPTKWGRAPAALMAGCMAAIGRTRSSGALRCPLSRRGSTTPCLTLRAWFAHLAPAILGGWTLGGMLLLALGGGLSAMILVIRRRRPSTAMA